MFNTHNNKQSDWYPIPLTKKGFTIIELLVVIAIIGLISSVVLVSMKGSTSKAKIAKSLEFSQTILNTTGYDAVGIWSFDEGEYNTCPGGTADVCDKSGYGNHGTITGATFVSGDENTPHWYVNQHEGRSALEFDGDDYIQIPYSSSLMPQSITIEAWIKFNSTATGNWMIVNKAPGGTSGSYYIYGSSPASGIWSIFGPGGARYNIALGSFTKEKWYHVVGTFDASTGVMNAYVNAKETGSRDDAALGSNTHDVIIGKYTSSSYYMDGLIDEVRIYASALGSSEIQQHYADGSPRHQLVVNDN